MASKKIESKNLLKKLPALLLLFVFCAGCKASNQHPTGTPTSFPIESITLTPQPPDAIIESLSKLENAGYGLSSNKDGWELQDKNGIQVLEIKTNGSIAFSSETGKVEDYSSEALWIKETIGAGVPFVLALRNLQREVEWIYLDKEGHWATPLQIDNDPKDIENYTEISLEDIWNGRVLYSELLQAAPFSETTLIPTGFVYSIWEASGIDYFVTLNALYIDSAHPAGVYDRGDRYLKEVLRKNNDPQRWIAFYHTTTPDGKAAIVGTMQVVAVGGQTSLFFHYIFGPDWPWDEEYLAFGAKINLIKSVFLSKETPTNENWRTPENYATVGLLPVIFTEYGDYPHRDMYTRTEGNSAGELLYELDQNSPLSIRSDLLEKIQDASENLEGLTDPVDWAGEEINALQYMALSGWWAYSIIPEYFHLEPEGN